MTYLIATFVLETLLIIFPGLVKESQGSPHGRNDVCLSEACMKRANYLLHVMDTSVNPCDDFYKFSCGNFLRQSEISENKQFVHVMNWINDYTQSKLAGALMAEPQPGEMRAHSNVKTLYKLCMDEAALDKRGVAPLLEKLEAAGGWPVLGNWNSKNWSLLDTELRLRDLGLKGNSLIELEVMAYDNPKHILLDKPTLSREFRHGEGSPYVQNHYDKMVDVAVILGADRQTAEQQLTEVLYFEVQFYEFMDSLEYNPRSVTVQKLTEKVPWFDWTTFIHNTIEKYLTLNGNDTLKIRDMDYVKNLGCFLKNYSNEVVANYMMWNAISHVTDKLTTKLRNMEDRKPRWEECLDVVSNSLSLPLSSLFAASFNKTKVDVDRITEKLRQELLRIITDTEWLDDETRLQLQDKLVRMGKDIAYPEDLMDNNTLDAYYDTLSMNTDNFFQAFLDVYKWNSENSFRRFREPVDESDWKYMSNMVREVNAFNIPTENKVGIPAGIIHNPFYDEEVPSYANWGGIGVVIGHEIVHSFDSMGALYDWEGKVRDFWGNESKAQFEKRTECIIDQYSNFIDKQSNLSVNGQLTQGENIADNGGFKIAYRAYKRLMGEREEPRLPGLEEFNNEQMIFISFSVPWCEKLTKEDRQMRIQFDSHSTGEFRVKGVVMNSPEFSRLFQCKKGAPMNPGEKCTIW